MILDVTGLNDRKCKPLKNPGKFGEIFKVILFWKIFEGGNGIENIT